MDEELSLRDIADVLGQYRSLIIGLPLALSALAFGFVQLAPRSFDSETVVTVNNNTPRQGTVATDEVLLDVSLLPGASALTQAYRVVAPERLANIWNEDMADVAKQFQVSYDDKSNAITMSAAAGAAGLAQQRAAQATNDFVQFANAVVTKVISEAYRARLQQVRLEIQGNRLVLDNLRESLAATPPVLAGRGQPSSRTAADAVGLDARFAGNADQPANPAYSYLAVKVAEVESSLAANNALQSRLETALRNPRQLLALARQATQINTLADARLPTEPSGVGAAVAAILGFMLGLFLAVILAFVLHALRREPLKQPLVRRVPEPGV